MDATATEQWIEARTGLRLVEGEAHFGWDETAELVEALLERSSLEAAGPGWATPWDDAGSRYVVLPPALQPVAGSELSAYRERLDEPLGLHLVVLIQAGAAALGMFEEGRMLEHKTLKKYVVRGSGHAQPAFLKSKGKSRYGSRLRLANARRLLTEVNERLALWRDELGEPEGCFCGCPVRTWAELYRAKPPPPFASERFERIGLDLRVPSLAELQRAYAFLGKGRLIREHPVSNG